MDLELNELEIAPLPVVKQSARDFAAALSETPQFKAFEQAAYGLRHDPAAQQALAAYQSKFESLSMMSMLNAVSEADRGELERLRAAYQEQPAVQAYLPAETELTALWRRGGDGLRHVHHFNEAELGELASASGFRAAETFYSDGEGGRLRLYQIWE